MFVRRDPRVRIVATRSPGCVASDARALVTHSVVMVTAWRALALLAALPLCAALPEPVYHNQFAVHVPAGKQHADDIARRHGFENHGQVRGDCLLFINLDRASVALSFVYYVRERRLSFVLSSKVDSVFDLKC